MIERTPESHDELRHLRDSELRNMKLLLDAIHVACSDNGWFKAAAAARRAKRILRREAGDR